MPCGRGGEANRSSADRPLLPLATSMFVPQDVQVFLVEWLTWITLGAAKTLFGPRKLERQLLRGVAAGSLVGRGQNALWPGGINGCHGRPPSSAQIWPSARPYSFGSRGGNYRGFSRWVRPCRRDARPQPDDRAEQQPINAAYLLALPWQPSLKRVEVILSDKINKIKYQKKRDRIAAQWNFNIKTYRRAFFE